MLGWMDVARQRWPLTSETERNSGLVSFISVKAAMGSGGSIEIPSANTDAVGGREVARNGSSWPGELRMAVSLEMGCSSDCVCSSYTWRAKLIFKNSNTSCFS